MASSAQGAIPLSTIPSVIPPTTATPPTIPPGPSTPSTNATTPINTAPTSTAAATNATTIPSTTITTTTNITIIPSKDSSPSRFPIPTPPPAPPTPPSASHPGAPAKPPLPKPVTTLKARPLRASHQGQTSKIVPDQTQSSKSLQAGHVFVLHADINYLCCDARLVPCFAHYSYPLADDNWFPGELRVCDYFVSPAEFRNGHSRVYKVDGWPIRYAQPWMTNVVPLPSLTTPHSSRMQWYAEGARDYLAAVATDFQQNNSPPKNDRERHLVALPILGTRGGGGGGFAGEIVSSLLAEMYAAAEKYLFDVALVTNDRAMYAAALNKRNSMLATEPSLNYAFACLNDKLLEKAKHLSGLLMEGNLVLFIGAGCSRGTGLPTWGSLLSQLASKAGMTAAETKQLDSLGFLDRASVIESRLRNMNKNKPTTTTPPSSSTPTPPTNSPVVSPSTLTPVSTLLPVSSPMTTATPSTTMPTITTSPVPATPLPTTTTTTTTVSPATLPAIVAPPTPTPASAITPTTTLPPTTILVPSPATPTTMPLSTTTSPPTTSTNVPGAADPMTPAAISATVTQGTSIPSVAQAPATSPIAIDSSIQLSATTPATPSPPAVSAMASPTNVSVTSAPVTLITTTSATTNPCTIPILPATTSTTTAPTVVPPSPAPPIVPQPVTPAPLPTVSPPSTTSPTSSTSLPITGSSTTALVPPLPAAVPYTIPATTFPVKPIPKGSMNNTNIPSTRSTVPPPAATSLASPMQIEVAAMTHVQGHTLIHALLASSPTREIITTNYDQCFEKASRLIGKELSVLPYVRKIKCPRWLLKMHGCVSHPHDIVITREDYIRYAERRAALAGIVQSLLITKHLLFIGFSLVDDNFFQIISAVKKALTAEDPSSFTSGRFGTSLNVVANPLMEEIWSSDLDMVTMVDSNLTDPFNGIKECGRRLDIFLDFVTANQFTDSAHVMESRFDAVLTESEKLFRDQLRNFIDQLPDDAKQSSVYMKFEQFMNNLGYDSLTANSLRTSKEHVSLNSSK